MAKCETTAFMVPANGMAAAGPTRTMWWCHAHQMEVPAEGAECPIGRIEKAADEAVERVKAAGGKPA